MEAKYTFTEEIVKTALAIAVAWSAIHSTVLSVGSVSIFLITLLIGVYIKQAKNAIFYTLIHHGMVIRLVILMCTNLVVLVGSPTLDLANFCLLILAYGLLTNLFRLVHRRWQS